ncbi:hypothetical protein, partial [Klebsiella pneumoniae]|uniref:hypothetical protein n=6 Tax=Klebsiella pneumoniae TaxID=573 RepID=UPI001D0E1B04
IYIIKKQKIVPSAFIQNPSPPPVVRFRTYTSFWFTSNVVIKEYVQIIMSGMSKKIAFLVNGVFLITKKQNSPPIKIDISLRNDNGK